MFSTRIGSAAIIIALITTAATAAPIALFQRLMLGTLGGIEVWWVRATAAGAMVGVSITILDRASDLLRILRMLFGDAYSDHFLSPIFGLIGLAIGFFQWPVLRRRVDHAGWWIVANLLAGLLIGGISETSGEECILGIFQLLTYTLMTGITLRLLLGQPRFDEGQP